MINIVYLIPAMYKPGGMERILTEKLNYLATHYNYKIYLITTDQQGKEFFFDLNEKVKVLNWEIDFDSCYDLPLVKKFLRIRSKLKDYRSRLENFLATNNIDICVSTGGKELEFLTELVNPCKKVLEIHFSKDFRKQFTVARSNSWLMKIIGEIRNKQLIRQTTNLDAVIALTKTDLREWEKTHKNLYQIYNFSSVESDVISARNTNRAIAVGKLDAQKGFDMLIDAWSLKKTELNNWELHIFGQGEWEQMLLDKIKKNNLEKNVFLRGVTKDIKSEFLKSSIFLFSSRYEGFSLVFIEAMNCGLPIVSFNCPQGPSELIINDDIGFLVEAGDIKTFSSKISLLSEDASLRKEMGVSSFKKSQTFSKTKIMNQWNDLFTNLLK